MEISSKFVEKFFLTNFCPPASAYGGERHFQIFTALPIFEWKNVEKTSFLQFPKFGINVEKCKMENLGKYVEFCRLEKLGRKVEKCLLPFSVNVEICRTKLLKKY